MQKKSLPSPKNQKLNSPSSFFAGKISNLFKNKDVSITEDAYIRSPNLLDPVKTGGSAVARSSPHVVTFTTYVVHATAVVFFFLIGANYFLDYQLQAEAKKRDVLISDIEVSANIAQQADEISKLIDLYKNITANSSGISEILAAVFSISREHVLIERVSFRRDVGQILLTARHEQAIAFAHLIADLIEIEGVKDIAIDKVELNRGRVNTYVAALEINLR